MLSFLWFALGLGALLVALALCYLLIRLAHMLREVEATLETMDDAVREVLPEVRGTLGNVNNIAAGLNVTVRAASRGAERVTRTVDRWTSRARVEGRAWWHGIRIAFMSLASSRDATDGGESDVR